MNKIQGKPRTNGSEEARQPNNRTVRFSALPLEEPMKHFAIGIFIAAMLGLPSTASAQKQTTPRDKPGHSESAPGQRADEPGEAKKFAPGQVMKKRDDPKSPGASEFAPGHQDSTKKSRKTN
jgi:hypothetical protein